MTTGPGYGDQGHRGGQGDRCAINRHCGLEPLEVEKVQEAREAAKLASFDPGSATATAR